MEETQEKESDNHAANGSLGVKGWVLQNITQLSAATILAISFLYISNAVLEQWKMQSAVLMKQGEEDRQMFRETLKEIRVDSQAARKETEAIHGKAFEKMGNTVEKAVNSLEDAVKEMKSTTDEVKRIRVMGTSKAP